MLSEQAIEEFRAIYRNQYGIELPLSEATKQASNLIRLYKTVLSPLLKQESMQASNEFKTLLKRSKPSLVREPHRISNQEIVTLDEIFKKSVALKTAYNLKNKLFDILHSRNLKHESFIETINAWRDEAQNEGIDCLIDFSNSLKGYKVIK